MKAEEQAAFYKALVQRGISMFPAPSEMRTSEVQVVVHKVLTTLDNRVHIEGANKFKGFPDEDAAVAFVVTFIDWSFESTEPEKAAEENSQVANCYFNAHMLVDLGFGPQNVALGQLVSSCQDDDWYQQLKVQAAELANKYLRAEHPGEDPDRYSKSIKVLPVDH